MSDHVWVPYVKLGMAHDSSLLICEAVFKLLSKTYFRPSLLSVPDLSVFHFLSHFFFEGDNLTKVCVFLHHFQFSALYRNMDVRGEGYSPPESVLTHSRTSTVSASSPRIHTRLSSYTEVLISLSFLFLLYAKLLLILV